MKDLKQNLSRICQAVLLLIFFLTIIQFGNILQIIKDEGIKPVSTTIIARR